MNHHVWKGALPRCVHCDCTSLVAQHLQPESQGVGPCPLVEGVTKELETRLLENWVAAQEMVA